MCTEPGRYSPEPTPPDVPWYRSCRVLLAFITAWGYVFFYLLRIDLSLAIVCMVRDPDIASTGHDNSSDSGNGSIPSAVRLSISQSTDWLHGVVTMSDSVNCSVCRSPSQAGYVHWYCFWMFPSETLSGIWCRWETCELNKIRGYCYNFWPLVNINRSQWMERSVGENEKVLHTNCHVISAWKCSTLKLFDNWHRKVFSLS